MLVADARDEYDAGAGPGLADALQQSQPVHAGEVVVRQDHVAAVAGERGQGIFARLRGVHAADAERLQCLCHDEGIVRVVLNDEDGTVLRV